MRGGFGEREVDEGVLRMAVGLLKEEEGRKGCFRGTEQEARTRYAVWQQRRNVKKKKREVAGEHGGVVEEDG